MAAAVRFARRGGHEISVRGGGHNVGGLAVADDAVMIDLAEMKGIQVDPEARTARAEGGLTWAELNAATAEHGLAVTGGAISTTGIAGLTLGGGLGWLMPKFGLAADNVLAVELVTADGEIVEVTARIGPGPVLGVARRRRQLRGGHHLHVSAAPARHGDRRADRAPDRRGPGVAALLSRRRRGRSASWRTSRAWDSHPARSQLSALVVCHTGDPDQAEADLAPFKAWGSPLVVDVGPMPYPTMNTILDEGYPDRFAQLLDVELHARV